MKKIVLKYSNLLSILILTLFIFSCAENNIIEEQKITFNDKNEFDKKNDLIFLKEIYFDFDSSELTTLSKKNLNLLAQYLKNNITKQIELSGYCDESGSNNYNYTLGLKRAEVSKNYLINLGIREDRIIIKSYGKSEQNNNFINKTKEEMNSLNRKVIINLL